MAALGMGSTVGLVLTVISLLHTQTVRELVLSRVFATIQQETGWTIDVANSELKLFSGFLKFQGLVAGADVDQPFLTAEAVEVRWIWNRIYDDGLWTLYSIFVLSPTLDLAAEIPEPNHRPETTPSGDLPLSIRTWNIQGATAHGKDLPQGWLAGWTAHTVDLTGSLIHQKIALDIQQGELVLIPREENEPVANPTPADLLPTSPSRFSLGGKLTGPLSGPWKLDDFKLSGDGLLVAASGKIGPDKTSEARLAFTVDADPGAWASKLSTSGRLQAKGDLDLRQMQGDLDLELSDLPAETVEPFLNPELFTQLSAAGTVLNADASFELNGPDPADAKGSARFRWHNANEAPLDQGISDHPDSDPGDHVVADLTLTAEGAIVFAAQIAPSAVGIRRLSGRLVAEDLRRIDQGQLQDGKVEISTPSLTETLSDLRRIWPEVVPAAAPDGELDLKLTVAGPLDAPQMDGGGFFRSAPNSSEAQPFSSDSSVVRLEITAQPSELTGRLTAELQSVSLGNALPTETALKICQAIDPNGSLSSQPCSTIVSGSIDLQVAPSQSRLNADIGLEAAEDGPIQVDLNPNQLAELDALQLKLSAEGPGASNDPGPQGSLLDPLMWSYSLAGDLGYLKASERQSDSSSSSSSRSPSLAARLDNLSWAATFDRNGFELSSFRTEYSGPEEHEPISIQAESAGRWVNSGAGLSPLVDQVNIQAELPALGPAEMSTRAHLRILDGLLSVNVQEPPPSSAARPGSISATMPLGTLADFGISMEGMPFEAPSRGPIEVWVDLPRFDSADWLRAFHQPATEARALGNIRGSLTFDPLRPTEATGQWTFENLEATTSEHRWISEKPISLTMAEGWMKLPMSEGRLDDLPVTLWAETQLASSWALGDPIPRLPLSLTAELNTSMDASSLNTFTAPFDAKGPLSIAVRVQGARSEAGSTAGAEQTAEAADVFGVPSWITAEFNVAGEGATLTSSSPYATRLANFEAEGSWAEGRLDLESLRADLNEGELEVFGRVEIQPSANPGGDFQLIGEIKGFFDRVRYRLDYGLTTLSSGNFTWTRAASSPDRLSANILVERGSARRRIDATRELLNQLLAPPALDLGPGQVPNVELDIDIATIDGIRIKNNLADLHASWDLLSVEGPLSAPRTHGSIDITPDGRVYAYGQVLRIDSASLQLSGNPSLPSRLELETTSSIEDPSIATPADRRFLASTDYPGSDDRFTPDQEDSGNRNARNQIASGLTTFYGNQLASRLGQSLGSTKIRYEPLWIFGETDPGARLVISQDLNAFVSLAVAVDVSQGREQVYLLDLHGLRTLPSLSATIFADEGDRYGTTIQQTLQLGHENRNQGTEQEPLLRDLHIEGAEPISKRRLVAWSGVSKGDAMPPGSDFDLEIDLAESLRQQGFPGAEIEARLVPVDGSNDRVDAMVRVELGPEVEIELVGPKLPRVRRREIRALYQTDFSQQASLEAMRRRTIEVWRSLGYPEPEVSVNLDGSENSAALSRESTAQGREIQKVTVHSAPGRQLKLKEIELRGLEPDISAQLRPTLTGTLTRIRLALEQPQAVANLKAGLASLGLPDATVDSISVSEDTLILEITPGPQRRIADIELRGFPPELRESAETAIRLKSNAPAAGHAIAEAALTAQWHLRSQGYPEATVRSVTIPQPGSEPPRLGLRLDAEPGPAITFGSVKVGPDSKTRESWVRRMATFEAGEPFDSSRVAETRRRLLQTRNFDYVRIQREVDDDGRAELTFDLEEKPPYTLAYGLRWDRSAGWGGLIDIRRLNAGGRGIGLGARALWLSEQKSFRLYGQVPRLLGTDWDLELYGEGFETDDLESVSSEGFVLSSQLSFPLGQHTRGQLYSRFERSESLDLGRSLTELEILRSPQIGMQWIHDRRDRPTDPLRGYFLSLDLTQAWDLENPDRDYRRIYGQASLFRGFHLLGRRWIWAQSIRAGAADVEGELRRSARFFAGGQYSIRGYDSRSLGPEETLDDGSVRAQGGEAMLVLNQELRIPLTGELSMAVFLDAGQVWGRLDDVDDALAKAAGLGARYRSPVGLLRLDVAVPIDPRPQDDDFEIYFGFGQSF